MATVNSIIEGLQILSNYADHVEDAIMAGAGHDMIFGPDDIKGEISEEHLKRLSQLGWFISDEYDTWMHFI